MQAIVSESMNSGGEIRNMLNDGRQVRRCITEIFSAEKNLTRGLCLTNYPTPEGDCQSYLDLYGGRGGGVLSYKSYYRYVPPKGTLAIPK